MSGRAVRRRLGEDGVAAITQAVRTAELTTAAELVVWVRPRTFVRAILGLRRGDTAAVRKRAERLFVSAGLTKTRERNAVLLYVSLAERVAVVLGDEGIDRRLGAETWRAIADAVAAAAGRGALVDGIVEAVGRIGSVLAEHFPPLADNPNELPDAPRFD